MRLLIIIVFTIFGLQLKAQTGNHVFIGSFIDIYQAGNGFQTKSIQQNSALSLGHVVSNYNGKLLFSFANGNLIGPDYSIQKNYKENAHFSLSSSTIIKINESKYYVFFEVLDTFIKSVGFGHLDFIKVELVNGQIIADTISKTFTPFQVKGIISIEDTIGGTWLIARTGNSQFTSYYFNDSCFACLTKISNVKIDQSIEWNISWGDNKMIRSPSGNTIASYCKSIISDSTLTIKENLLSLLFDFNKETGELNLRDTIFYGSANLNSDSFRYGLYDFAIANNDSFIFSRITKSSISGGYISNYEFVKHKSVSPKLYESVIKIIQNDSLSPFFRSNSGCLINLSDGKLYYSTRDPSASSFKPTKLRLHEITNTNKLNKSNISFSKHVFDISFSPNNLFISSYSKYNYIRVNSKIDYKCVATVTLDNLSDRALPETQVSFFIRDLTGDNEFISIDETKPLQFNANGKHLLKVVLKSDKGRYLETHFDTLHIRIPEKPIADFMVSDTIACRFSPVQFFNSSRFMTVKPGEKVEYRWDFGDGETMVTSATTPIFHTYKQPGRFTVSLRISNGYCDSILIKSNFMRITDAPAPGFSVSATQGCAPFAPHFTDTVSENVTRKEYFFSDENQWVPITNNHFSHTFQKPGTYYAVQRLHGYTGCVTQTDTVTFFVSKGLTLADTAHTHWASYMTNERIDLAWPSVDGAIAYALFKTNGGASFSATPLQIITDTFYSDVILAPDRFAYAVKAIDSCGNMSSFGRIAKPILLKGSGSHDNKTALLTFTPYQQWEDTIIYYSPEFLSDNGFIRLDVLDKAGDFIDADFAQSGAVEKCYRIRAANDQFESFSNQICVPYSPFIFMPTAFSPNDDGLNDVFIPITYGIESLNVKIYNRWGEKIIELKKGESWDGMQVPQGQYLVIFTGQAKNGEQFFLDKPLMLVR